MENHPGLMPASDPANGMPSSTINGLLSPGSERCRECGFAWCRAGLVEFCVMSTPGKRPCRDCVTLGEGTGKK